MKQWVQKLIEQLDYGFNGNPEKDHSKPKHEISEDRATLLYVIDLYNKHLFEIDTHPVRKVRAILDEFAKELVNPEADSEKVLFRLRQFFSHYRVDEYTYVRKTFEDFKGIIWDFVDQLAEDVRHEQIDDSEIASNLEALREAVQADSIEVLRAKSREFIDNYVEKQSRKDVRREKRIRGIKKNLDSVKKKLDEAYKSARQDHLTGAWNRKSFDEALKEQINLFTMSKVPVTIILLDIDHFKKINDGFGHDVGDFALKECVRMLHESFSREHDFVARIGGEEFAVLLPEHTVEHAIKRAEDTMAKIRKEVWLVQDKELRFTISMGIAQLQPGESGEQWLKRADQALYQSKHGGRNRYTVAADSKSLGQVA
ncbi:MAG: GGDEF domain-containing protein [Bdellovibrionaceae bacterium]|nr:GGDEF domain-containing protein [Pseudobdellovibrionaceae bacterium]